MGTVQYAHLNRMTGWGPTDGLTVGSIPDRPATRLQEQVMAAAANTLIVSQPFSPDVHTMPGVTGVSITTSIDGVEYGADVYSDGDVQDWTNGLIANDYATRAEVIAAAHRCPGSEEE